MSATKTPQQCAHTAALASVIAADLATMLDLIGRLIADGSEDADTLTAACHLLARSAVAADTLARAHGGSAMQRDAAGWLFPGDAEAFRALAARGAAVAGAPVVPLHRSTPTSA